MHRRFADIGPIGLSRVELEARARRAASEGNPAARMLLRAMEDSDRRTGRRPPTVAVTPQLFASWRCPECGAKARTARGREGTIRCARGHLRTTDGKPPAFSLARMLRR